MRWICDEDGSDDINVQTDSTYWEELCLTDATVEDAATLTNERDDAFDLFGEINFFATEGDYYKPTTDTSSTFPVGSGRTTLQRHRCRCTTPRASW